ncbi:cathelicidin-6-like [Muntiacus reevesi]|uniref:cathelicidin-6-like n=1 Tax=Muntiacus reevesi TaxID=9886 RepID=UPI003307B0D1
METQRASLSLGRWPLWLLLLGLVLPSASAQSYSYRRAVLRAVDQFNEQSSEANLYRLLELDPPPEQDVEDHSAPKPVSFRVKETICPRTSQQPLEQCDFKENGLVKQCVGTVTLYQSRGDSDITCNDSLDATAGNFAAAASPSRWQMWNSREQFLGSPADSTSPESPASPFRGVLSALSTLAADPLRARIERLNCGECY